MARLYHIPTRLLFPEENSVLTVGHIKIWTQRTTINPMTMYTIYVRAKDLMIESRTKLKSKNLKKQKRKGGFYNA